MKILLISVGILLLAFIVVQLYAMNSQKSIETYAYVVTKKYDSFEIRNYEASLFTSIKLDTKEFKKASSKGFSILAGYIFGGNQKNQKIAMTTPVAISLEDSMTVMFLVPKKFNKETLPQPSQSRIEFREEPAKTVAAMSFGGWAHDKKIEKYKLKLKKSLDVEGIKYSNRFYYLGYNPPFEVFNRKNEVIVELMRQTIAPLIK
jgi:hypothetical protein